MIGHILIYPGEERFGGLDPVARWLIAAIVVGVVGSTVALVLPGFVLEGPTEPLAASDAIIVISGDEAQSRFRDGLALYRAGWAPRLIFSGAAWDGSSSNAETMRDLAIQAGVPSAAILVDPEGEDTYGNAVGTRDLMVSRNLHSAILVTSPYHARRAKMTFDAAYAGSGIALMVHAAPDSEWRKQNWWQHNETRRLTITELQKLAYIFITGQYH